MLIHRVAEILQKHKVDYAIAGGFAVALHGALRGTVDVDIVIKLSKKNFENAQEALKEIGLEPKLPVEAEQIFDFREDYIRNRNLIAWSFVNSQNPSEIVDIILTHDLSLMKTQTIRSQGHTLKVLSIEDLISMKEKSGRPQDIEDVKALKRVKK